MLGSFIYLHISMFMLIEWKGFCVALQCLRSYKSGSWSINLWTACNRVCVRKINSVSCGNSVIKILNYNAFDFMSVLVKSSGTYSINLLKSQPIKITARCHVGHYSCSSKLFSNTIKLFVNENEWTGRLIVLMQRSVLHSRPTGQQFSNPGPQSFIKAPLCSWSSDEMIHLII